MRIHSALLLTLAVAEPLACSGRSTPAHGNAPAGASSAAPLTTWARSAFPAASAAARPDELPVLASADPTAFDELLAAAAKPAPARTSASRIGRDTGLPPEASAHLAPVAPEAPRPARTGEAEPTVAPIMSPAAIERAARAQLYWNLVQRCRDGAGNILPPDVIRAQFNLDAEGALIPSSVIVTASEPRFSEAARCMQRELATTPFRVPLSTRGAPKVVSATIPLVD